MFRGSLKLPFVGTEKYLIPETSVVALSWPDGAAFGMDHLEKAKMGRRRSSRKRVRRKEVH